MLKLKNNNMKNSQNFRKINNEHIYNQTTDRQNFQSIVNNIFQRIETTGTYNKDNKI